MGYYAIKHCSLEITIKITDVLSISIQSNV